MNSKRTAQIIILTLLVLAGIVVAIFLPFNAQLSGVDFYIVDANGNYHYETGETLTFKVNDPKLVEGQELIWHLGNGDSLTQNESAQYTYKQEGEYLVSLTDINNKIAVSKYLKVVSGKQQKAIDSVPEIHAINQAYEGEEIVFSSEGPGMDTWYWEFGETGTVDAYKQQVVYVYTSPGTYRVKLSTNTSEYPVYHTINILPRFERIEETITVDSVSLAALDIKERLQAIANTKVSSSQTYYRNVNYIKNKYLCDNAEKVVIIINGDKFNDFYSYCQGLHFLESSKKKRLKIEKVEVDRIECIEVINVTQNTIGSHD